MQVLRFGSHDEISLGYKEHLEKKYVKKWPKLN